ncbi:MAG: STAS domain-containing protein [Actinobacteria bacterium]|nr:STAS domain-containing protein [Actinomycetota bacterium]
MSAIEVETAERDGVHTLALQGELDISNAHEVERELYRIEATVPSTIVLDLRGLRFMDSTGLRLVVAADARARDRGWRLAVVPGPDAVHRVFQITFVDKRLDFVPSPDELGAGT